MKHDEGICESCGYKGGARDATEMMIGQMYCDGGAYKDIAYAAGKTVNYVTYIIHRLGIKRNSALRKTRNGDHVNLVRDLEIAAKIIQGKSGSELGREYGLTRQSVSLIAERMGVKFKRTVNKQLYPCEIEVTCTFCGGIFKFLKKRSSSPVPKRCGDTCPTLKRNMPPHCSRCGSKDNLNKSGVSRRGTPYQLWICSTCVRAREAKYGQRIRDARKADPVRYELYRVYHRERYQKKKAILNALKTK